MGFDRSFEQARYFSLQFSGKNSTFSKIYTGGDGCNGDSESESGDTRDFKDVTLQINDRTCMRATGDESERILEFCRHFADDNSSVSVGDDENLGGEEDRIFKTCLGNYRAFFGGSGIGPDYGFLGSNDVDLKDIFSRMTTECGSSCRDSSTYLCLPCRKPLTYQPAATHPRLRMRMRACRCSLQPH